MSEERKTIHHHTPYREAYAFAEGADKKMLCGGIHEGETTFNPGSMVFIQHEDGTLLHFQSAFVRIYRDYICVFTEHHGVHVYHMDDLHRWDQFQRVTGPRPKLKGSGRIDKCDDCGQEFSVDDLEYGHHPDFDRYDDFVALCDACYKKATDE